jgi:hypothetical protein
LKEQANRHYLALLSYDMVFMGMESASIFD